MGTVSCLLVALPRPQRFDYFKRSVAAYCRQTHRDKELVIVLDRGAAEARAAICDYIAALERNDIRIVASPAQLSLGALRNLSVDSARGSFLCQWDDDDLHHPERVECQHEALVESGKLGVVLEESMQFFPRTRTLYCTNWRAIDSRGLPGTLMWARSAPIRYPEEGYAAGRGEDSAVCLQLLDVDGLHVLKRAPHLYVYVSHGENTFPDEHHRMLATELAISKALLLRREAELREGLRPFDFGPGDVTVEGYNGVAFSLSATPAR